MKKLVAIVLVIALALSIGGVAMAKNDAAAEKAEARAEAKEEKAEAKAEAKEEKAEAKEAKAAEKAEKKAGGKSSDKKNADNSNGKDLVEGTTKIKTIHIHCTENVKVTGVEFTYNGSAWTFSVTCPVCGNEITRYYSNQSKALNGTMVNVRCGGVLVGEDDVDEEEWLYLRTEYEWDLSGEVGGFGNSGGGNDWDFDTEEELMDWLKSDSNNYGLGVQATGGGKFTVVRAGGTVTITVIYGQYINGEATGLERVESEDTEGVVGYAVGKNNFDGTIVVAASDGETKTVTFNVQGNSLRSFG